MAERPALPAGMTPRLLNKDGAAAYCGMTPDTFEARVRPHVPPLPFGGRPLLWDVKALDRWLDDQSGLANAVAPIEELIGRLGSNDGPSRRISRAR